MDDRTTPPAEPAPGSPPRPPADTRGVAANDGHDDAVVDELATLRAEAAHLRAALTSRAVIDQAKGILMHRFHLDPPAAFALLKRLSQDHNVKVRDLAGALVATTAREAADHHAPDGSAPHEALVAQLLSGRHGGATDAVDRGPVDEGARPPQTS